MRIFIERLGKEKKMDFKGSVGALLIKLDVNPETVIVTRNNELITDDVKVGGDEYIKILSVLSGG